MRMLSGVVVALVGLLLASAPTRAAETFRDCPDCPQMIAIPGGTFSMGSAPSDISSATIEGAKAEYLSRETPQHDVTVKPFEMSVTEVTRDQFELFVRATGHQAGGPCWVYNRSEYTMVESSDNNWRDPGFSQTGNHPLVCVNWNDAKAYVRWLSQTTGKDYRLPSEAEWEYAARAGTATASYWGSDITSACKFANLSDRSAAHSLGWYRQNRWELFQCTDGFVFTAPVAQFQANAFGLNDMLGNVWEWTEDCYNPSYSGAPTDGSAWLTGNCSFHVYRGGDWYHYPWAVRFMYRVGDPAEVRLNGLGFRVARTG